MGGIKGKHLIMIAMGNLERREIVCGSGEY